MVMHQILYYLKETSSKGIIFKKMDDLMVEAYTNSDYVGSIVDRVNFRILHILRMKPNDLEK